jgi:hypothetical protein
MRNAARSAIFAERRAACFEWPAVAEVGNDHRYESGETTMKGLFLASTVGVALLAGGGLAEAGSKHYSHGHHGHHHHDHHGSWGGYYSGRIYAGPVRTYSAPIYRPPVYHDTTHYDDHPPSVYRHGSHYHYVPGHYDLHRSGHWHY